MWRWGIGSERRAGVKGEMNEVRMSDENEVRDGVG